MAALLQPPPLLTMVVVLLLAATAMWLGLRSRPARNAALSAGASGQPAAGAATEAEEEWGMPDPPPPVRRPFSYERLVADAPDVDSVESPSVEVRSTAPAGPGAPLEPADRPTGGEQPAEGHAAPAEAEQEEISLADIFTRGQRRRDQE